MSDNAPDELDGVVIGPRASSPLSALPYPAATDPVSQGAANIQALATALDAKVIRSDGTIRPTAAVMVTMPNGGQGLVIVGSTDWVGIRLDTGRGNAGDRNYEIMQGYFDFGQLDLRVSNAPGGDPVGAGKTSLRVLRSGAVVIPGASQVNGTSGAQVLTGPGATPQYQLQAGSWSGVLNASGEVTIPFPIAFAATPVSIVVTNGDTAAAPAAMLSVYGGAPGSFVVHVASPGGAAAGAIAFRINWMALGALA